MAETVNHIEVAIRALLNGEDGSQVLDMLKTNYSANLYTLSAKTSEIKSAVLDRYILPQEYNAKIAELQPYIEECPDINKFLKTSHSKKYDIQRMHVKSPQWPAPAEELLQAIPLAPKGISTFFLSAAENARLKAMKKVSRKSKNKSVHRISDAPATLKTAESLLNNANSKAAFHKLQLPLLLVTGRRFAEIMNGRSKFTPIEDQPYHARFTGQLKRKRGDESEMEDSDNEDDRYDSEDDSTYKIPLLVPFDTFEKGWKALREKQEIQDKKHAPA